jgi:2-methylisocitrate lyase-like PEP mutase family enzyme
VATQAEKAAKFVELHERDGAFVVPNPWDVGSALLLAALGFEALATTSSGFAIASLLRAGREMHDRGGFGWTAEATSGREIGELLARVGEPPTAGG